MGAVSYAPYPSAPPPPEAFEPASPPPPAALKPVVVLLIANLVVSIALTIAVFATRKSLINYQLDHRHITDPAQRSLLRSTYSYGIWARAAGNIIASVVYVFLVRSLIRGRRSAYRRVVMLGILGIVALLLVWTTPYPTWMRVEQIGQALILAALLYFVTRPEVRSHFPKGARRPGRFGRLRG
jgi:hypothetical protein